MRLLKDRYVLDAIPRPGGMAQVFPGYDVGSGGTRVAVKIFTSQEIQDEVLRVAYDRELRALSTLQHPGIVALKDHGTEPDTGHPYLVLEWMEADLAATFRTRRYPGWDDFYEDLGRPILDALRFAHERHIAHRDVKPRNILLDSAGNPKLADFGISKLKTWLVPELTLNQFASRPFSPPECDDGSYTYSRDVFAFCVLSLSCLCATQLNDYADVYRALDTLDLPPAVYELFKLGTSSNPADRPDTASVLLALLDTIRAERSTEWVKKVPLFLHIPEGVWPRLFTDFSGRSKAEICAFLANDLNNACGVATYEDTQPGATPRLSLFGATVEVLAALHRDNPAQLVVLKVREPSSHLLDQRRERALQRPLQFRFASPEDSAAAQEAVLSVLDDIREHERDLETRREAQRENELFGRWSSVLNLKNEIEKRKEHPLVYTSVRVDETAAAFRLATAAPDDIVGQTRCLYREDRLLFKGDVESVEGKTLHLRVDFALTSELPTSGSLIVDNAAAREAIRRQRVALDDAKFDRAVRSDLRKLLLHPELSAVPSPADDLTFVHSDLDQAKQDAVAKALGATDLLLVQGPPGTGKTTFITETILQLLWRTPTALGAANVPDTCCP